MRSRSQQSLRTPNSLIYLNSFSSIQTFGFTHNGAMPRRCKADYSPIVGEALKERLLKPAEFD